MGTPIDSITVAIDGEEFTIFRDEMLKDKDLRELLVLFDSVNTDLDNANVEFMKLKHAQTSVHMSLQQQVLEYTKTKFRLSPAEAEPQTSENE